MLIVLIFKRNIRFWIIGFVVMLFVFTSCQKKCLEKLGGEAVLVFTVDDFNRMELYNNFTIYLVQDSITFVELKGKENIISNIKSNVDSSTLSFKDENTCKLLKGYNETQVYIHFVDLKEIVIEGSPTIYSKDTLVFNRLNIKANGEIVSWDFMIKATYLIVKLNAVVGEIKLKGEASRFYLYSNGRNHCYLKDLKCVSANTNHSSLGDVYLTVSRDLRLDLNNSGDFYCYGNPMDTTITVKKDCTGEVFFKE